MERYPVDTTYKGLAWTLLVIGALFALFGGALLLIRWLGGGVQEFSLFSSVAFLIQGALLALLGWMNLRSGRYFIAWDQKEIQCYLPAMKRLESFEIDKITGVEVQLFEIHLHLGEEIRTIHLENAQFKEIRRIKDKFEEIKRAVEA